MAIRNDVPSIEITQYFQPFNERGIQVRVSVLASLDLKPDDVVQWHFAHLNGMATVEKVIKERNCADMVFLKKRPALYESF